MDGGGNCNVRTTTTTERIIFIMVMRYDTYTHTHPHTCTRAHKNNICKCSWQLTIPEAYAMNKKNCWLNESASE